MTPSDFGLVVLACFFSVLLGVWLESWRSRHLRQWLLDDHAHEQGKLHHQLEVRRLECDVLRRRLAEAEAGHAGLLQDLRAAGDVR